MDWQKLISQFDVLKETNISYFAPPADSARAIGVYNRAVNNIHCQNTDIALIALRKLAASYPRFALPALLAGVIMAGQNNPEQARQHIGNAIKAGLEPDWQKIAEYALAGLDELEAASPAEQPEIARGPASSAGVQVANGVSAVLEKTGRKGKVRMASQRERENVIRRGENQLDEETKVKSGREPAEYLRIILPAAGLLIVVALLVFFGIWLVTGINENNRQRRETADRLAWLLHRLENIAGSDSAVSQLLADYEAEFTPETLPTESASEPALPTTALPTAAPAETTAVPTPRPTTAATTTYAAPVTETTLPLVQRQLIEADQSYRQGIAMIDQDIRAAGNLLLEARGLLAEIPAATSAPDVESDAGQLSQLVENAISRIARNAAEANRRLGMELVNQADYEKALAYFLTAFALHPRAYGGGVAYYCGLCHQMLGQYEAARPYYEFVILEFPDRDIAGYARNRLRQMGN